MRYKLDVATVDIATQWAAILLLVIRAVLQIWRGRAMAVSSAEQINVVKRYSSAVTGLEWPRGFQEVKVKQSRYRPGVAQRVPGS
jgi:hypothetical protein